MCILWHGLISRVVAHVAPALPKKAQNDIVPHQQHHLSSCFEGSAEQKTTEEKRKEEGQKSDLLRLLLWTELGT